MFKVNNKDTIMTSFIFSKTSQSLSQSILLMKGTEWYLLRSKLFQFVNILKVFLHLENLLSLEENFKNTLSSFHVVQSTELQLFEV